MLLNRRQICSICIFSRLRLLTFIIVSEVNSCSQPLSVNVKRSFSIISIINNNISPTTPLARRAYLSTKNASHRVCGATYQALLYVTKCATVDTLIVLSVSSLFKIEFEYTVPLVDVFMKRSFSRYIKIMVHLMFQDL